MLRRSTLVVLGLFMVALVVLLIIQRNPGLQQTATPTPAPTAMAKLLPDWTDADVEEAELVRAVGGTTSLSRNPDDSWNNPAAGTVAPGKVEQLLSELLAANILLELPQDYSLEELHLQDPGQKIILRSSSGRETTILVGGLTPTQSGYYVKVDDHAAVVVSKTAIETVLNLFDEALPAAEASPTP